MVLLKPLGSYSTMFSSHGAEGSYYDVKYSQVFRFEWKHTIALSLHTLIKHNLPI